MTLQIRAKLDVPEALRRGKPCTPDTSGEVLVALDDTVGIAERQLIAGCLDSRDGRYVLRNRWSHITLTVPEATVAGVVEAVRAAAAEHDQHEAAKAAREAETTARIVATIRARREQETTVYWRPYRADDGYYDPNGINASWTRRAPKLGQLDLDHMLSDVDHDALTAWLAEIEAANAAASAAAQATYRKVEAEQKASADAVVAERAEWIAEHGSNRLKRLAKEGIEHSAVYRDERLALDRPGWRFQPKNIALDEPRNPPEAALDLLDAARESDPAAKLFFATLTIEADYDPEHNEYEHFYAAQAQFLGRSILFSAE